MSIIIGRRPGGNGQQKQEITKQSVSRSHARLTQLSPTKWRIEDIGSTYGTCVNGLPIVSAEVEIDTPIMLADFATSVRELLGLGRPPVPVPDPDKDKDQKNNVVSVRHLEKVYYDYQEAQKRIQKQKSRSQLMRMLPTSLGIPCVIGILGMVDIEPIYKGMAMVGLLSLSGTLTFRMFPQFSQHIEEQFELNQQFQIDYVCPKCKNFFGAAKPYQALINQGKCPYCKSVFKESKAK